VRDFLLNEALKRLATEAATRFSSLVASGDQIPFDVAAENGEDASFFSYVPLTSRFVEERAHELRSLPSFGPACEAAVAVRENRYVAQSIGIRPLTYALLALGLGAFLTGMAGGFYAHYISFVGPEVFGFPFMLSMIIMVLVGGKGTLLGPLLGALLVTFLEEYLREAKELRLSIFGLAVMAVVLFMPRGLMGFLLRRREQRAAAVVATVARPEGVA